MAELVSCPECKKHLQVPEELLGKKVQCPECKHTFTATLPDAEEAKTKTTTAPAPPQPTKPPSWEKSSEKSSSTGKKKQRDDDDDDDDDRRRRRRDDDDDDDDDLPRRRSRSRSSRHHYDPHRGGMILAFGIIGLLVLPIFSILAWVMGNADMREIQEGRMDPEGEGMTQVGRILGIIGTVLWIIGILVACGIFAAYVFCIAAIFGAAINAQNQNFPPPPPPRRF